MSLKAEQIKGSFADTHHDSKWICVGIQVETALATESLVGIHGRSALLLLPCRRSWCRFWCRLVMPQAMKNFATVRKEAFAPLLSTLAADGGLTGFTGSRSL